MATNKSQLHNEVVSKVQEFCESNKMKAQTTTALMELVSSLLAPKKGGATSQNASYTDANGTVMHYCRFHQQFEPESDMVLSQGKNKGYCKASISIWNKRNSAIKAKEASIAQFIIASDIEAAKSASIELQDMKANLNEPSTYDYDSDWNAFRA